jgi:hypothetical protein
MITVSQLPSRIRNGRPSSQRTVSPGFSLTRTGSHWLLLMVNVVLLLMVNVVPISIQIQSISARRAT